MTTVLVCVHLPLEVLSSMTDPLTIIYATAYSNVFFPPNTDQTLQQLFTFDFLKADTAMTRITRCTVGNDQQA